MSRPKFSIICSTNIFTRESFLALSAEFKIRVEVFNRNSPHQRQCAHVMSIPSSFLSTFN